MAGAPRLAYGAIKRLLKKAGPCFVKLSMNGIISIDSRPSPFLLRLSKDSEGVFPAEFENSNIGNSSVRELRDKGDLRQ